MSVLVDLSGDCRDVDLSFGFSNWKVETKDVRTSHGSLVRLVFRREKLRSREKIKV